MPNLIEKRQVFCYQAFIVAKLETQLIQARGELIWADWQIELQLFESICFIATFSY